MPIIKFILSGIEYELTPNEYIIKDSKHNCVAAFMAIVVPYPRGPLFVLGDTFMRK